MRRTNKGLATFDKRNYFPIGFIDHLYHQQTVHKTLNNNIVKALDEDDNVQENEQSPEANDQLSFRPNGDLIL